MSDSSRRNDNFRTTILSLQNSFIDNGKVRFISPEKWKNLMLKSLSLVSEFNYADQDLIHDLKVVINNIGQDKYIQAILSFQPFKPKFRSGKLLDLESSSNRLASTAANEQSIYQTPKTKLKQDQPIVNKSSPLINTKVSYKNQPKTCQSLKEIRLNQKQSFLQQYLQVIIQEQSLKRQFEKKYHPFKKIIDSFVFILQNKFKSIIDQAPHISLQKIQQLITYDVLVIEKLFLKISQPYLNIFQSQNPEQTKCFKSKMTSFVKQYIQKHEKITTTIRKIMRHHARKSKTLSRIQQNIDDFVSVQNFNIPDDFKIDGCYIQSMNSLMEFAEESCPQKSLKKLKQFRTAIARDVDDFYESINQTKQRQINAEVQIQIVRFILHKLKGWTPEIFAQLKYLEVIFGDEDIAFKYDDASYIYAQIVTVFDAMDIETSIGKNSTKERVSLK